MDGRASGGHSRELRRIFWRGYGRDLVIHFGLVRRRHFDASQRLEADHFVQHQFRSGDLLYILRKSGLAFCTRDGCFRFDRREPGWTAGRPRPPLDLALDRGDDWRNRGYNLFCSRMNLFMPF